MPHRLHISDQGTRVWATVEMSEEVASHLQESPVGTLSVIENVARLALTQTGVLLEGPLHASIVEYEAASNE